MLTHMDGQVDIHVKLCALLRNAHINDLESRMYFLVNVKVKFYLICPVSSVGLERLTVNQERVGSNPTRGAFTLSSSG